MAELSEEVVEFLSAGTRTGMLGYLAADGRPLVAPVWFVPDMGQDDGELVFNTGRDTSKGRALARDPRVVICVDNRPNVELLGRHAWFPPCKSTFAHSGERFA